MRTQDCPEQGRCCESGRICCPEQLLDGCRALDVRLLDRTYPTLWIGPRLPCGLRHCRAFGACAGCARSHGSV